MRSALTLFIIFGISVSNSYACDPCSLYNAARIQGLVPNSFTLSISEQNTSFDRPNGSKSNDTKNGELVREFSTTQFGLAYDLSQEVGFQLTIPVILRQYDQIKEYRSTTKSDFGIGDSTILTRYSFIQYRNQDWNIQGGLTAGVKLPTGDTGTLGKISQEEELNTKALSKIHHQIASASGGRALTLGTGSIDYILGANLFTRYQRFFYLNDLQYSIRREGDFNYEYANDLIFSSGPGYYLQVEHQDYMALRLALTGEFKGADRLNGSSVKASKISNIYLGPEFLFALSKDISGQIGVDVRTTGEESGATVVPEFRVRAALAYRFSS